MLFILVGIQCLHMLLMYSLPRRIFFYLTVPLPPQLLNKFTFSNQY